MISQDQKQELQLIKKQITEEVQKMELEQIKEDADDSGESKKDNLLMETPATRKNKNSAAVNPDVSEDENEATIRVERPKVEDFLSDDQTEELEQSAKRVKSNKKIRRESINILNSGTKGFRPIEMAPEFVDVNFDIEKDRLREAARMKKLAPYLHTSKRKKAMNDDGESI